MARPLIVIDPQPRSLEEIFEPKIWARLKDLGELAIHEGPGRMPGDCFEANLPEMELLIGQSDMPKSRLDRAKKSDFRFCLSRRSDGRRLAIRLTRSLSWRFSPKPSRST